MGVEEWMTYNPCGAGFEAENVPERAQDPPEKAAESQLIKPRVSTSK
jgi:hypothetical protein